MRFLKSLLNYVFSWVRSSRYELPLRLVPELGAQSYKAERSLRRLPVGWVTVALKDQKESDEKESESCEWIFYPDEGGGFSEINSFKVKLAGGAGCLIRLPRLPRSLRFDLVAGSPRSPIVFYIFEENPVQLFLRLVRIKDGANFWPQLFQMIQLFFKEGSAGVWANLLGDKLPRSVANKQYQSYIRRESRACHYSGSKLMYTPLISVVMPVYNTPLEWLKEAINSVLEQSYSKFELCIADDASTNPEVCELLRDYVNRDPRIKVCYRETNGHISAASNSALSLATGEYVAFLDHDDLLPPHALYEVARVLNAEPGLDLIFSDEDRIDDQGNRFDPYFKPGYQPELLFTQNLISHLGVYRAAIVQEIRGFRVGYEGSQDWDLALRFIERIPPGHIRHLPKVLYHWRLSAGSVSFEVGSQRRAIKAGKMAVADAIKRRGQPENCTLDPMGNS